MSNMVEALKNPHYKKILERVIMNRHPEVESLEKALKLEIKYYDCFFSYNDIVDYVGHNNKNFRLHKECYDAMAEECADKLKFFQKKNFYTSLDTNPTFLGRPITLEDISMLLPNYSTHLIKRENSLLELKIFEIIDDKKDVLKYKFDWQLTKFLHEQTPKTWEKISNSIDNNNN